MQPAEVQGSGADRGDPRGSWQVAHEALVALARKRAGLDLEEGRWLLRALRGQAHTRLGYGSFTEYVERWFGYVPRLTREKLRVAEALEHLPRLAAALEAGKLSFSVARELTRVATPDTERAWLDAVRGSTVRQVETLVSGQRPGSLPGDPPDASAVRHVLRFEVTADVLATFREAMTKIRREAGEPLDDDAALLLLARHVLGGSRDEGRSSYQIALDLCENCQRARQHGASAEVPADVVAMARCDAQHIGSPKRTHEPHVGHARPFTNPRPERARQSVSPAVRRAVLRRDGGTCTVPGARTGHSSTSITSIRARTAAVTTQKTSSPSAPHIIVPITAERS